MAEKEPVNKEQEYVKPLISWGIIGGELALAIILALIIWL